MRTLLLLLSAAVAPVFYAKKEQPKPAVIEVLEATAHRDQNNLNIDGHIRNTGERPAVKLVIIVDILDSDKQPLTTMKGGSDPESIDPGRKASFTPKCQLLRGLCSFGSASKRHRAAI